MVNVHGVLSKCQVLLQALHGHSPHSPLLVTLLFHAMGLRDLRHREEKSLHSQAPQPVLNLLPLTPAGS